MNVTQSARDWPMVSVIIPAYNAERFIQKTLYSVLAQTYSNLEVIVIDDGSQDSTAEKVKEIAQQDPRIYLFQQQNSGVAAARNLGIAKARGEFIAPIDADDIWTPQNLEKQVNCLLESDSWVGLTYAWSVDIDEKDRLSGEFRASTIEGKVYPILLLHDFIANASSTVFRRSCLEKVGGYNCDLKAQEAQGCEDWELYLRVAEYYKFRVIPEFLVGYRRLSNSMSSNAPSMAKSRLVIWQSVLTKYPNIPKMMYRLSMSSFYMYLARKSSQYGQDKDTLLWLSNAVKIDWITPFLRVGFYPLLIKSVMASLVPKAPDSHWVKSPLLTDEDDGISEEVGQEFQLSLESPPKRSAKSLAESLMPKIISAIFGTPDGWQMLEKSPLN